MSKRNSKEAKQKRRTSYEEKQLRFSNPCPHPEKDYLRHFGYVPNEPFFYNSAVAVCNDGMKLAMRSKQQLIDYVKETKPRPIQTRSGKGIFYISLFKNADYKLSTKGDKDYMSKRPDKEVEKSYYIIRENVGCAIGEPYEEKEWWRNNPFYESLNTFMIPEEKLKDLPELAPTDEELIDIGKEDEAVQPLNEMELDQFLSQSKEHALRKGYEFNDDGLIIDEFICKNGTILYQPRKKDECWLQCVFCIPFVIGNRGLGIPNLRDNMQVIQANTGEIYGAE